MAAGSAAARIAAAAGTSADPTGRSPLLLGLSAQLHGQTLHAEVCRAVLMPTAEEPEDPPHAELNINHAEAGTALHWAAEQKLHQAAMALVSSRHFARINAVRECDRSTVLHIAAAAGSTDLVRAILAHPDFCSAGSIDCDGFTALHGAAYGGHVECVKILLSCKDGLAAAAAEGTFDMPRPPRHWAAEAAKISDMRTALHMAAVGGHADICRLLLGLPHPGAACGANVANRVGATALHLAARGHHTHACLVLLGCAEFTAVNARDIRGFTALHWSAQQPSGDICAALLEREDFTEVEGRDLRGRTALQIAEAEGRHEVRRLITKRLGPAALQAEASPSEQVES